SRNGLAEQALDLGALEGLIVVETFWRDVAAALPVERRQHRDTVAFGKFREAHIHHDGAGEKPERHHEAGRDAEVAVRGDQHAPESLGHVGPFIVPPKTSQSGAARGRYTVSPCSCQNTAQRKSADKPGRTRRAPCTRPSVADACLPSLAMGKAASPLELT